MIFPLLEINIEEVLADGLGMKKPSLGTELVEISLMLSFQ